MLRGGPCPRRTVTGRRGNSTAASGWALAGLLAGAVVVVSGPSRAEAAVRDREPELSSLVERVSDAAASVSEAEKTAAKDIVPSDRELAERLVAGQLQLEDGDYERAAITFLDLIENHPDTSAGIQAVYYLGVALIDLDMPRWAVELFSRNLGDGRPEAERLRQKAVARLLDLCVPDREPGFAQRPGLSAMPEVRARLTSLGVKLDTDPPKGIVPPADMERLERWAESFAPEQREPMLQYAYGRYLFLTGKHVQAAETLDQVSPLDIPMSKGGPEAKWRVRAAYVAAAAALAAGDIGGALERFAKITRSRPSDPRDAQIVTLAWIARGRIHHDLGETDEALRAYRRIGRDSPFFPEVMYETAWTLLAAQRYDQAIEALDLLLVYDPDSAIAPEIKQLRGKVEIQQRRYEDAEKEFLALREEFKTLSEQLDGRLQSKGDASAYFAAVVGEDLEDFSLAAVFPRDALPVARSLGRAVQAESIARQVGVLERQLDETRDLLARMEQAVATRHKSKLFTDLNASQSSLRTVDDELIEVQEALIRRLADDVSEAALGRLENQRVALRGRYDNPLRGEEGVQARYVSRLRDMEARVIVLDRTLSEVRAGLVATERYFEYVNRKGQGDPNAFLAQAAQMRNTIAELEKESTALRRKIDRSKAAVAFDDGLLQARERAITAYRQHLAQMYAALAKVADQPEVQTIWARTIETQQRGEAAKQALESAAAARLQNALTILREERDNLDRYLVELQGTRQSTQTLVAEVLAAANRDVVGELGNFVLRSEVGLLDVAWGIKEAEAEQIRRLESERDRDIRDIDATLDLALEELKP